MVRDNLKKVMCGLAISALLLVGAWVIDDARITVNAALSDDLAQLEENVEVLEGNVSTNATELDSMNYIVSDDVVMAVTYAENLSFTTHTTGTVSVAKSGYTPIGVVGFAFRNESTTGITTNGNGNSHCTPYGLHLSGNTVSYKVNGRTDTGSKKVALAIYVLYVKNV